MFDPGTAIMYTPEQAAQMLQLNKNTIYELINRGEIVAKRIGKVLRIPAKSLSYVFTGLDEDLYQAEIADFKVLPPVQDALSQIRASKS